jgi:hypothetical protein
MFEETDNDADYSSQFRAQGSNSEKMRARAKKATRANRRPKATGTPANSRLRRNKHWSW